MKYQSPLYEKLKGFTEGVDSISREKRSAKKLAGRQASLLKLLSPLNTYFRMSAYRDHAAKESANGSRRTPHSSNGCPRVRH